MSDLTDKLYHLIYDTVEVRDLPPLPSARAKNRPVKRHDVVIRQLFMSGLTLRRLAYDLGIYSVPLPIPGCVHILDIPVAIVPDMPDGAIAGASFVYGDPL
jgi:hypothetical protein